MFGSYNRTFYRVRKTAKKSINNTSTSEPPTWSNGPKWTPDRRWQRRAEFVNKSHVNLVIAAGMLCIVVIVVLVVFYFSQRSFRKHGGSLYRQQPSWLEADSVLDVYTVDQHPPADTVANDDDDAFPPIRSIRSIRRPMSALHQQTLQPPPSYESAIAASALPPTSQNQPMAAHTETNTDAVPLLPQQHQQQQTTITTPCCCHLREQPHRERQTYAIIKQCRQCRRQIRTLDDEYDQDDDDIDVNVKYCECLLGPQSTDGEHEHGDDDVANDKPQLDQHRAERRLGQANLGKPIRATDTEATAAAASSSSGAAAAWLQNVAAHSVAAKPPVVTRCAKDIGGAVDADDDDDLHARLVTEKLDGMTDNSGSPSYDVAAKLRPTCVRLN